MVAKKNITHLDQSLTASDVEPEFELLNWDSSAAVAELTSAWTQYQDGLLKGWVLVLPGMPDRADSCHNLKAKAAVYKKWIERTYDACKAAQIPHLQRIRIDAALIRSTVGLSDYDNDVARLKPIMDGLVRAGVVRDDKRKYLQVGWVKEYKGRSPEVRIRITKIDAVCMNCDSETAAVWPLINDYWLCSECLYKVNDAFLRSGQEDFGRFLDDRWIKAGKADMYAVEYGCGHQTITMTMPTRELSDKCKGSLCATCYWMAQNAK